MKVKILTSLILLVMIAGLLLSLSKTETQSVQVDEISNISFKKEAKKVAASRDEKPPTQTPIRPVGNHDLKKDAIPTEKTIARETELEFLQMKIPKSLSNVNKVRYQEVYSVYQKSSFYLSEIAADRLETNKENLSKAFKGLILYFNEGNVMDQMDSALVIIKQENPGLFDEAMGELAKKDQVIVEKLLSMQIESE